MFDSLWHGMSVDIFTECSGKGNCKLNLYQTVSQVIDIVRSLRKKEEGGIPKPTAGEKLRCDTSKEYNIWQCFPLSDPIELQWDLETLYGRTIRGPAFEGDQEVSRVKLTTNPRLGMSPCKRKSHFCCHEIFRQSWIKRYRGTNSGTTRL